MSYHTYYFFSLVCSLQRSQQGCKWKLAANTMHFFFNLLTKVIKWAQYGLPNTWLMLRVWGCGFHAFVAGWSYLTVNKIQHIHKAGSDLYLNTSLHLGPPLLSWLFSLLGCYVSHITVYSQRQRHLETWRWPQINKCLEIVLESSWSHDVWKKWIISYF